MLSLIFVLLNFVISTDIFYSESSGTIKIVQTPSHKLDKSLLKAVSERDMPLLKELISRDNISYFDLTNILMIIVNRDDIDSLNIILKYSKKPLTQYMLGIVLVRSSYLGRHKVLSKLLDYGVNPNYVYLEHDAFLGAIATGNTDLAKILINSGYTVCLDFNKEKMINPNGNTYRQYVKDKGYDDIYEMLPSCMNTLDKK